MMRIYSLSEKITIFSMPLLFLSAVVDFSTIPMSIKVLGLNIPAHGTNF